MSGKKGHGGGGGGGGGHDAGGGLRWLLTYADMITLLLALFIYLYSISEVSASKMAAFTAAFSQAFGIGGMPIKNLSPGINPTPGSRTGLSKPRSKQPPTGDGRQPGYKTPSKEEIKEAAAKAAAVEEAKRNLGELKTQLEQQFPDWLKQGSLTMLETDEGLMLRLRDNTLFEKGSADLAENAQGAMALLTERLAGLGFPMRVEGHTDDLPLAKNSKFADNWDLSGARAASVVRYFISHNVAGEKVSLAGYGEFRPIEPNVPGRGNPVNRRVEILVVAPVGTPAGEEAVNEAQEAPAENAPASATEPGAPQTPPLVFSEPEVVPPPATEVSPPERPEATSPPVPPAPRAHAP